MQAQILLQCLSFFLYAKNVRPYEREDTAMKRIICAMMCTLLLLCGAAMAETAYRSGWEARFDDIAVTSQGRTVELRPALALRISMPDDLSAVQAALEIRGDDASLLGGLWIEEDGVARIALSNSDSCTVLGDGRLLHLLIMQQYLGAELASDEALADAASLPHVLPEVEALLADTESIEALLGTLGTVEREGNALHCTVRPDEDTQIRFALSVTHVEEMGPLFDLSGRAEVAMNAKEGLLGAEHMEEAALELADSLMQEESIAELAALLGEMEW